MESNGMSDAHSIISSDAEKFTSLLPGIFWRPTNLTSLANATLTTDSFKPPAFMGTLVYIIVTSYLVGTGLLLGSIVTIWTYIGYFAAALIVINFPTHKRMSVVAENLAKCQANFKYVHSRIRLHAETIGLYSAEDVERAEVENSFDAVGQHSKELIVWQAVYQGIQSLFQYVPFLISSVHPHKISAFPGIRSIHHVCSAVYTGAAYVQDPNVSQADSVTYIMTAATLWRVRVHSTSYCIHI